MGKYERQKGKRGERELANLLKSYGYNDCHRGKQYCGDNGNADVIGLPGIYIECKRVEKLCLESAMNQAIWNAELTDDYPTVFHRKNRGEWMVTMRFIDWIKLYRGCFENEM